MRLAITVALLGVFSYIGLVQVFSEDEVVYDEPIIMENTLEPKMRKTLSEYDQIIIELKEINRKLDSMLA